MPPLPLTRHLYTSLHYLAMPLVLLRLAWRGLRNPGYYRAWHQRFGWGARLDSASPALWIHAVSVGEVQAAIPLVRALRRLDRNRPVVVTTTTPTGRQRVIEGLGCEAHHCYVPYDLPGSVNRFLARIEPRLVIVMETELWPNMLHACRGCSIPVLLANARMSERSAARYARVRALAAEMLGNLSTIAAQTEGDAARLIDLGAVRDRIHVTGSIKFDVELPAGLSAEAESLRRSWGADRPVWIAASTHQGEEELVLDAFAEIRRGIPDSVLLLVPRHPERFAMVATLCRKRGYAVRVRTEGLPATTGASCDVFVGDTMGELALFYAASEVAFVGGSLVPVGGHNMLEPAALARPVLSGPHVFNFPEIDRRLTEIGAARRVRDAAELGRWVADWLLDANARHIAGERGRSFVEANRGALGRVVSLASDLLEA